MNSARLTHHVANDPNPGCEHIFVYKGIRCSQSRHVFKALDDLHDATWLNPPTTVIEIGTLYGAFTQLLRDHDVCDKAALHTFDIRDTLSKPLEGTVTRHIGDIFLEQFPTVVSLIQQPGRAFVFCDGGNKEREVNVLCQHLKKGDLILCHDYMKDPAMMGTEAAGYWPGCESQWSNIQEALTAAGCVPFIEELMQKAVWGCFIKT